MIELRRTNSGDPVFIALVRDLDAYLAIQDGDQHPFYAQYNTIENIKCVIIAFENNMAVGCGAIKEYRPDTMEIKRMFTLPVSRGKGIATKILSVLEAWATELGYVRCILETGKKQPEAIALYERNGYKIMANYGQYAGVENSLCFEKTIRDNS